MRATVVLTLLLSLLLGGETAAYGNPPPPTQRQWMAALVEGLGWSFGLPDEPQTGDFERILKGERRLRIEAEEHKQPGDVVSIKTYRTFGDFSGEGWVSGISSPTTAHLRFVLPLGGTYRVSASLRLPGHEIEIGGEVFRPRGERRFTEVDLGTVELAAGPTEVVVHLPPNGSIDYLELSAPALPEVRPLEGWEPERPLTMDDMAVTAVRAMELEGLLPPGDEETVIEAEEHAALRGAGVTAVTHLGAPSGGRWVRAGTGEAEILLSFTPPEAGVYTLLLRAEGRTPLRGLLNDRDPIDASPPPYLQTLPVGTFYLSAGENTLRLRTGSRGGVDALILRGRRSAGEDYRRLAGLPLDGSPPTASQMDALLSLLAAIGARR